MRRTQRPTAGDRARPYMRAALERQAVKAPARTGRPGSATRPEARDRLGDRDRARERGVARIGDTADGPAPTLRVDGKLLDARGLSPACTPPRTAQRDEAHNLSGCQHRC